MDITRVAAVAVAMSLLPAAEVTVSLEARTLDVGRPIRAAVRNGLAQTIYTEDGKSDCSIVVLERRSGPSWIPIPGCALGRAPRRVALASGETRVVVLDPASLHFRAGATSSPVPPAIGPGVYRIRFGYRLTPGPEGEETRRVYSETFEIAP